MNLAVSNGCHPRCSLCRSAVSKLGRVQITGLLLACGLEVEVACGGPWQGLVLTLQLWVPDANDPEGKPARILYRTYANLGLGSPSLQVLDLALTASLKEALVHEVDEGYRRQGLPVSDPHPEDR